MKKYLCFVFSICCVFVNVGISAAISVGNYNEQHYTWNMINSYGPIVDIDNDMWTDIGRYLFVKGPTIYALVYCGSNNDVPALAISSDGGVHWDYIDKFEGGGIIRSAYVTRNNSVNTIYAVVELDGDNESLFTLYKSTDDGKNWASIWKVEAGGSFFPKIAASNDGKTICIVSFGYGLFFSLDSGKTWSTIPFDDFFEYISGVVISDDNKIYISQDVEEVQDTTSFFVGIKSGDTIKWEKIKTPQLIRDRNDTNKFFVDGVGNSSTIYWGHNKELYISNDGGSTWGYPIPFKGKIHSLFVKNGKMYVGEKKSLWIGQKDEHGKWQWKECSIPEMVDPYTIDIQQDANGKLYVIGRQYNKIKI